MSTKWMGAVFVLVSCGGFGAGIAGGYRRRERLLRQLMTILENMEAELGYHLIALPELTKQAASDAGGILRDVFLNLTREQVLGMTVDKQERDIGLVLSMLVCCLAGLGAVSCLEPAMDFFWELQAAVGFPAGLLTSLIKAVGIALVAEIAAAICGDAGKAALGKMLQMLGSAAVLTLSLPLFRELMRILKEMVRDL